jgi:hypothetical protein
MVNQSVRPDWVASPPAAARMARWTKGKARASFSPASEVRPKRTSSSSPDLGGPTCTSEASTGSVGAIQAPNSSAMARLKPSPAQPRNATAAMVRGMAMASSRDVVDQLRQPGTLSIFRPAPIRLMMTTSSVRRSVAVSQVRGSG